MLPPPFIEKEGYVIYPDTNQDKIPIGDALHIKSDDIEGCMQFMQREGFRHAIINRAWGYHKSDIDFLSRYPWVEGISIIDEGLDISAVNSLKKLKHLTLSTVHASTVDGNNFPDLTTCIVSWNNKIENLDSCVYLKQLVLFDYPGEDLAYFSPLINLEYLSVFDSTISSVKGVEKMQALTDLELWNLLKLKSISPLVPLKDRLKRLYLYGNKNLFDYEPVRELVNLEHLNILNGGPAQSVDFLRPLEKLKIAGININVLDGDVEPCVERNVLFKDYKHFNRKTRK